MKMDDRYRRTAHQFEELDVGSLVDLVQGLGWGISRGTLAIAVGDDEHPSGGEHAGFRRKDSNLRKRNQKTRFQPCRSGGFRPVHRDLV
jgi:hypothetical protein